MPVSQIRSPRVAVLGSIFLDLIYDRPFEQGVEPVQQFHGGIGRNVAENLGWLGLSPRLITLITPDSLGERIATELSCAGVELAARYINDGIGIYQILVQAGEVAHCRIEQPRIALLDWSFVREQLGSISHAVVETGLDQKMMQDLLTHCRQHGIRVCGIPTRLAEMETGEQLAIIRRLDTVIMNLNEAETLLCRSITHHGHALEAVAELQRIGVPQAVITLGRDGAAAGDSENPPAFYTTTTARIVSTLGCGDAFTAGFVAASALRYPFATAIEAGFELARRTTEASGAVRSEAGKGLLAALGSIGNDSTQPNGLHKSDLANH